MNAKDRAEIVIGALRAVLAAKNLRGAKLWAQVGLDFATNDREALAEGRALQDSEGDQ